MSLLLDRLTVATAAYSTRKLRTAYDGAALRVRRSSDDAEQDIGFTNGALDTSSLLAFVGASNGYVTTLYDQSINSNDQTQTVNADQPQIVSAGTLITINSIPAWSDMGGKFFGANVAIPETDDYSFFALQALQAADSRFGPRWFNVRTHGQGYIAQTSAANAILLQSGGTDIEDGTAVFADMFLPHQVSVCGSGGGGSSTSGSFGIYADGTVLDASFKSVSATVIGMGGLNNATTPSAGSSVGSRSELIFFSADMSADRAAIESSQSAYLAGSKSSAIANIFNGGPLNNPIFSGGIIQ